MSTKGFRRPRSRGRKVGADPTKPDERVLQGLADAVRRAREFTGAPPAAENSVRFPPKASPPQTGGPSPGSGSAGRLSVGSKVAESGLARAVTIQGRRRRQGSPARLGRRRLPVGPTAGALIVLAAVGVLVIVTVAFAAHDHPNSNRSAPRHLTTAVPTSSAVTTPSTSPTSTVVTTTTPTTTTTTTTSTTSTTVAVIPPGSDPQLISLSPAEGGVGTVFLVHGAHFLSDDGIVLARIGGHPAPTDCPTQTMCRVTVPDISEPGGPLPVTITTTSGTSNALAFEFA